MIMEDSKNEYVHISLEKYNEFLRKEFLLKEIEKDLSTIIEDMRLGYDISSSIYILHSKLK